MSSVHEAVDIILLLTLKASRLFQLSFTREAKNSRKTILVRCLIILTGLFFAAIYRSNVCANSFWAQQIDRVGISNYFNICRICWRMDNVIRMSLAKFWTTSWDDFPRTRTKNRRFMWVITTVGGRENRTISVHSNNEHFRAGIETFVIVGWRRNGDEPANPDSRRREHVDSQ